MEKYVKILILSFLMIFVVQSGYSLEFGDMSMGSKVDIHGYISQGYMKSSGNNMYAETSEGTNEFSETAFNIGTDVSDNLHIGMQILARKLGEFGKGGLEIDWGYADYRWKDWLGVRAGKMKFVHGLYNTTRDADFLRTSIFLPQSVYNEAWRDTVSSIQGGEVYGDIYLGMAGSLAYDFQAGNNEYPVDSGVATTTEDQARLIGMNYSADDYYPKYGVSSGLVWSTPLDGLKVSLTGWVIEFSLKGDAITLTGVDTNGNGSVIDPLDIHPGSSIGEVEMETRSAQWTGSVEYTIGNLIFAAEYSRNNYDFWVEARTLGMTRETALETEGYYGSLTYRFATWFEAGFYYSEYFADRDDKDGKKNELGTVEVNPRKALGYKDHDAWLKDACLSLRFDITDNWVFKLEGHKMNGAAILMKEINSVDGKLNTDEDWYLGAMKLTFNF